MFYVEVFINGKKANLLIDTGASFTLLDITQADKYGFKPVHSNVELIGLGGRKQRYHLKNCYVDHKNQPLLLKAYGADMGELIKSFSDNGLHILGIIGSDYFTMANAVIDYKNKKLILNWRM